MNNMMLSKLLWALKNINEKKERKIIGNQFFVFAKQTILK
jgi:hypothetical protein